MDCYGLEDFVGLSPPDVWGVPDVCAADERGGEDHFTNFNKSRDFDVCGAQSGTQIFYGKNDYKANVETVTPSSNIVLNGSLDLGGYFVGYNENSVDRAAAVRTSVPMTIPGGFGTTTSCGSVFGNNCVDQNGEQNLWGYGQPGLNAEMVGNFETAAEANTDITQLGDSFEWLETSVDVGKLMSGTQTTQHHSCTDEFQSADVFIKHIVDECNEFEKKVRTSTGNLAPRGLPPTPAGCPSKVARSLPIPVPPSCRFSGDSGWFHGMSTSSPSGDYVPNGHYSPDLVTMEPVVYSPVQVGREIEVASAVVPEMLLSSPPSGNGYNSFEMGENPCPIGESVWLPSQMSGNGIGLNDPSPPPTSPNSEDIIGGMSPPIIPHGAKHVLSIPLDESIALTQGTIIYVTVSNGAHSVGQVRPAVQHEEVIQIQPSLMVMGANNHADGAVYRSGVLGCEDVLPMAVNHLSHVIAGGGLDAASRNARTNLVINRGPIETQLVQMVEEAQDVTFFANTHHHQVWNSGERGAAYHQQSGEIVDVEDGGMINVVEEVVNTSNVVNGNYQARGVCDRNSSIVGGQALSGAPTVGVPTQDCQIYVVNQAGDEEEDASSLSVQRGRKLLPAPPKKSGGGKAGAFLAVGNPSASQESNQRSSTSLSSTSSAGTLGKEYARGSRPYPVQREIKKQQNREAACRYRMKQKAQKNGSFSELDSLEGRNSELKGKVEELEREVSYLKNLMVELRQMKD